MPFVTPVVEFCFSVKGFDAASDPAMVHSSRVISGRAFEAAESFTSRSKPPFVQCLHQFWVRCVNEVKDLRTQCVYRAYPCQSSARFYPERIGSFFAVVYS